MNLQNITLYREAVTAGRELMENNRERGKLVQIFQIVLKPFDAGIYHLSVYLADKTVKHFPFSCPESWKDPISTAGLIKIVQFVKRVSGSHTQSQPFNIHVLHYAGTCTKGAARGIFVSAKDCEVFVHVPDSLGIAVDKVCRAVQEEIINPIVRDGVELGGQMVRDASNPPKAIEQAAPPPSIEAAPEPVAEAPQASTSWFSNLRKRSTVSPPQDGGEAPEPVAAAPQTSTGWFSNLRKRSTVAPPQDGGEAPEPVAATPQASTSWFSYFRKRPAEAHPQAVVEAPETVAAAPLASRGWLHLIRRSTAVAPTQAVVAAPEPVVAAPQASTSMLSGLKGRVVALGRGIASGIATGASAGYSAGKYVAGGVSTGVSKTVSASKYVAKVGTGFAIAGISTAAGYWATKKLTEVQNRAKAAITEKEIEVRKKVVALAVSKTRDWALRWTYAQALRGGVVVGTYLVGRRLIAHDKENEQWQMVQEIAGYATLTFSFLGTLLWIRCVAPTVQRLHRLGSAPFDPNVSTAEEVTSMVMQMTQNHADKILPIIEFVRSKTGGGNVPVYIANFTRRVVNELPDIPAIRLAFPNTDFPLLLPASEGPLLLKDAPAANGPRIEELRDEEVPLLLEEVKEEDAPEGSIEEQLVAIQRARATQGRVFQVADVT